jgi:glycolate oxidase FAD binding subunit
MGLGNSPSRYDLSLATTRLDRIIEHEAADMTVTAQAGLTLARLQGALAEQGQFLPIDAPAGATLGGAIATAASGPSRHGYGLPRDWLIGCKIALADGSVVKGGGRVVKNVAGYDLPRLVVGSLGALGIIVEATFKVAPLPAAQYTLLVTCESVGAAVALILAAGERPLSVRAMVARFNGGSPPTTAFWLSGIAPALERTRTSLLALPGSAKHQLVEGVDSDRWWESLNRPYVSEDDAIVIQASLPRSSVPKFIDVLESAAGGREFVIQSLLTFPTTGHVTWHVHSPSADGLVDAVEQARGFAKSEHGFANVVAAPVEVKQRIDVWDDVGTSIKVMRRLKSEFDPNGVLNPGRFVSGI